MDLAKYRTPPRYGPRCSVGRLLDDLDHERATLLRQILADPQVVWTKVEEHSAEDFGTIIKAHSASRHHRGRCACD